jgi:SLOG cluster3 family
MSTADSESTTLDGRHVFLSAGIPGSEYPGATDRDGIAAAVRVIVPAVFRAGGRLLFGGQPGIVALVLEAAEGMAGPAGQPRVTLYQSALYADVLPGEVRQLASAGLASVVMTPAAPGDAPERGRNARSLALLRDAMLNKENDLVAGIFIGGMDGVRSEFEQFRESFPSLPAYIFGGPGGEARQLAQEEMEGTSPSPLARLLAESDRYDVLIAEVVRDAARLGTGTGMPNSDRLQMIQGVITRLAGNSGALKGFAVPVVTALLGVGVDKNNDGFVWLGVYPVIAFGFLDAFYLALEKKYRDLYKKATTDPDTEWGLAAGKATFMDVLDCLKSPSIWAFYGAALVVVIVVALIL